MQSTGTERAGASAFILGAAAIVALALIASRADFIPLWDGRIYADCIRDAASHDFRPYFLRCVGHSSYSYLILAGLAYKLAPGSPLPILLVDALLFAAACVAFHRLLRLPLSGPQFAIERAAATAAFALQPSFLATVVQPNIDLPVLAGFLWCLVTLIERRWVWTVLVGLATVFTKETGAVLYALALTCYAVWQFARDDRGLGTRVRAVFRLAPLAIPLAMFGAYLIAYAVWRPTSSPFSVGMEGGITASVSIGWINEQLNVSRLLVPRFEAVTVAYAVMIFVLNFAWIPTIVVLANAAAALRARIRGEARNVPGTDGGVIALCGVVTGVVVYFVGGVLTWFSVFTNTRYVTVPLAMLLLMFGIAVVRLGLPRRLRYAVLGGYVALLVPSALRTIDPVSRLVFGTFPFGSHEFLRMTSLTGECCGPNGRDQLVYSLQFTVLDDLLNQALVSVNGTDSLTIILPKSGDFQIIGPTDSVSGRRTLSTVGIRRPQVIEDWSVPSLTVPLPSEAWYFALPYHDTTGLRKLSTSYTIGAARVVERDGYRMAIYPLKRDRPTGSQ